MLRPHRVEFLALTLSTVKRPPIFRRLIDAYRALSPEALFKLLFVTIIIVWGSITAAMLL